MRMARRVATTLILLAVCVPSPADEAEDAFKSLYGTDYEKVRGSRDKADDVALAAKLLETAAAEGIQPPLATVLCEKALELGSAHPDGYDTAIDAADRLAEVAPAKRATAYAALVDVREKQHRAAKGIDKVSAAETLIETFLMAADAQVEAGASAEAMGLARRALRLAASIQSDRKAEIQTRMDRASSRLRVERELETLAARVEANPTDAATRNKAVRLCLAELDDPARALALLDDSCDDDLKKYLPAVAKGVDKAPELACMELGEWYRKLADEVSPAGQAAMLRRSRGYYQRFLDLHEADDLARNQATLALAKVDEALAKADPATEARVVGPGRWVDLLPLVSIKEDVNREDNRCRWRDDGLYIDGESFVKVALPCMPQGDYQVQVTFMRPKGSDISSLSVYMPVGPKPGSVNWTNQEHAVMGPIKPAPEKGVPGIITNKQEHTVEVTVRHRGNLADITVLFDGKPHLHWQGPVMNVSPHWILHESKRLGFGEAYGSALLKRYRLRMLSGRAQLLRPLRKVAGKRPASPAAKAVETGPAAGLPNAGFEELVKGNVLAVETRDFRRDVSVSPRNQGYHYNRNAGTYMRVGDALSRDMVELLRE